MCLLSHQTITWYVDVDSTHTIVIKLPICYLVFQYIYISLSVVYGVESRFFKPSKGT